MAGQLRSGMPGNDSLPTCSSTFVMRCAVLLCLAAHEHSHVLAGFAFKLAHYVKCIAGKHLHWVIAKDGSKHVCRVRPSARPQLLSSQGVKLEVKAGLTQYLTCRQDEHWG